MRKVFSILLISLLVAAPAGAVASETKNGAAAATKEVAVEAKKDAIASDVKKAQAPPAEAQKPSDETTKEVVVGTKKEEAKKEEPEKAKAPVEEQYFGSMDLSARHINFRGRSETYPKQFADLEKKLMASGFELRDRYDEKLFLKLGGEDIGSADSYASNAKLDWRGRAFLEVYKNAVPYNGLSSVSGLTRDYSTVRKSDGIGAAVYAGPHALLRYGYGRTELRGNNRFADRLALRTEDYFFSAETVRTSIPFRATFARTDFSPSAGNGDFYRESYKYEAATNSEAKRPFFYAKAYSAETINKFDNSQRYTEDGRSLSAASRLNDSWKMTLSGYSNGYDNYSQGLRPIIFATTPGVARYNFNNAYNNRGMGANFYYGGLKKAYLSFGVSQDRADRNFFGSGRSSLPSTLATNYRVRYTIKPTKSVTYSLMARFTSRSGGGATNVQDATRPIYPFFAASGKRANIALSANQVINKNLSAGLTLSQNKVTNDGMAAGGAGENAFKQAMFNASWTPGAKVSVNYSGSVGESDLALVSRYYILGALNTPSNRLYGRDVIHTLGATYFARTDTDVNLDFTNSVSTGDGIVNAIKIGEFTTNLEWLKRLKNGDEVSVRGTNIKFYDRYFPVNDADTNIFTLNYKLKF